MLYRPVCLLRAMLLVCSLLMSLPGHGQGTCGPSPLGAPCASGGLAIAGQPEPSLPAGVGNPIHVVTGNKYQQEIDLPPNPSVPGIELIRHYNALDRRHSVLGQGWALSYDTRLFYMGGTWQIVQADGSRIHYANSGGKPLGNPYGTLEQQGQEWVWTWPNRHQFYFDLQGWLLRVINPSGVTLTLHRSQQTGPLQHTIHRIENGQGGWLEFSYRIHAGRAYLDQVNTALGRFHYDYHPISAQPASSRLQLTQAKRPDGMRKQYLYEPSLQSGNTHALTGIVLFSDQHQTGHRLNTWAYDAQGRAILSISGPPDSQAGKVQVSYPRAPQANGPNGQTLVTYPDGRTVRYSTAIANGRHVVTSVSHIPCKGCTPSNSTAHYNDQGQLISINGTQLQRTPHGQLTAVHPAASGWPGLALHYASSGRRQSWHSTLTGTEHMQYNAQGLPLQQSFQNGDVIRHQYDAQGRPVILASSHVGQTQTTQLAWHGSQLARIEHPHATEQRHFNDSGRLVRRQVERVSAKNGKRLVYSESFEYDANQQLVRHHLPEGGSLSYEWQHGRLSAIYWHDTLGNTHTVISSDHRQAGYRYGNGLHLHTRSNSQGQTAHLALSGTAADGTSRPIWTLDQHYNPKGLLTTEAHTVPTQAYAETWHHAYNSQNQLIGAQALRTTTAPDKTDEQNHLLWYAWQPDGALAGLRHNGSTHRPVIQRDPSGLPYTMGNYQLEYGPERRLSRVSHHTQGVLAHYLHDAFGHRIAKITPHIQRDYFYLDKQLVAEADYPVERGTADATNEVKQQAVQTQPLHISRRYIYAGLTPVGLIVYPDRAVQPTESAQLYAIHADLVGAPRLVTDSAQHIRWMATYSPTGEATKIAGDLTLDLRLPGQVFDAETGWHDNLLRTYLPESGQYLEPDPLGPVPGNQALGYADQQTRRYIDPYGLLLFAFDGTRNNPSTRSNVWKLSQAYLDGPVYYHSGPGTPLYPNLDALTARQAEQILENQWQSLLNALNQYGSLTEYTPIDIIGYSRGAALGRHFGNLINQYTQNNLFSYNDTRRGLVTACIDLRFMGLFDTVAQFGLAGALNDQFDLTIAAAWEWVAHAVALHERRWTFPLTSATGNQGMNIVEAPFLGAHADIGGGILPSSPEAQSGSPGDLADVALNWMLWQARAATVRFDLANPDDRQITRPILHDQRPAITRSIQDGDRSVSAPDGSLMHYYQDDHPALGRDHRQTTETLITRYPNWRSRAGAAVGTVDMNGYAQWLRDELGWQALPS